MKRKVLFVSDWPDNVKNGIALQKLLEKEYSDNYEWTVWSCKKKANNNVSYRWRCYFKGALYVIRNRKKYDAIFIWQQMVGYVFFELRKFIPFKTPAVVLFTFIYNSDNIFGKYKKHFVKGALRYSKGVIWPSSEMADEVKKDFPKYRSKNHFTLMPMFDIIDNNIWDIKPGPTLAASDGFWIFLKPLPMGEHIIKFQGIEPNFRTDVTYNITIN